MAAMMLMLIQFNNGCTLLKFITINIIAAIWWPPPLISQLFSPRLFKAAPLSHSLAVSVRIVIYHWPIEKRSLYKNLYNNKVCVMHMHK